MKKQRYRIFLTVITAMVSAASFTSCGNSDGDDSSEFVPNTERRMVETIQEYVGEPAAETEPQTDESAESSYKVYSTDIYEISLDENKWESTDAIFKYEFWFSFHGELTAETDSFPDFYIISDTDYANVSPREYAEENSGLVDSRFLIEAADGEINGYETFELTLDFDEFITKRVFLSSDKALLIINLTAPENVYDEVAAEFYDALSNLRVY